MKRMIKKCQYEGSSQTLPIFFGSIDIQVQYGVERSISPSKFGVSYMSFLVFCLERRFQVVCPHFSIRYHYIPSNNLVSISYSISSTTKLQSTTSQLNLSSEQIPLLQSISMQLIDHVHTNWSCAYFTVIRKQPIVTIQLCLERRIFMQRRHRDNLIILVSHSPFGASFVIISEI